MILPLLTIPTAIAMAPRIEIYNLLVCSVHRPEILNFSYGGEISSMQGLFNSAPHSVNPSITTAPSFQIQLDRRTSRNVTFMDASMSAEKRCASDPVVRVAVAKLTTGRFRIMPPKLKVNFNLVLTSNNGHYGNLELPYNRVVGIGKSPDSIGNVGY